MEIPLVEFQAVAQENMKGAAATTQNASKVYANGDADPGRHQ